MPDCQTSIDSCIRLVFTLLTHKTDSMSVEIDTNGQVNTV